MQEGCAKHSPTSGHERVGHNEVIRCGFFTQLKPQPQARTRSIIRQLMAGKALCAEHLHRLHGAWGPYPNKLDSSTLALASGYPVSTA